MKHILLVHDEQEDPGTRKLYLESVGYLVTLCPGAQECLRLLDNQRPDVVVMDVLIRGQNGFEVCRRIRERFTPAELPVILCSAVYRKRVFREEAWDAGAQGYLLKPVDPEDLVTHIEAVADRTARQTQGSPA